ncbi:hypothetical protein ACFLZ4_01915 [Patescibacteria group bacterium]
MFKLKSLPIILGALLSILMGFFGYYYVNSTNEKKALSEQIQQMKETPEEESTETEEPQEDGETQDTQYAPPTPPVYVDPNPITSCSKDKCGTKQISKNECETAVCCEIKDDVYKWADSSNECNLFKLENARKPVTLPHNGSVYYCDESAHDAIKQASQYKIDGMKAMDECFDKVSECEEKEYNEYKECATTCNKSSAPYAECGAFCEEMRSYMRDICGSSASCIDGSAIDSGSLNELIDENCD